MTARRQAEADGDWLDAQVAEAVNEEREAVVRHLCALGFKDLAGDIEAGEHRKS